MVSIQVSSGQGLTQAIAKKLNLNSSDLKGIKLSTWQKVLGQVNDAQKAIDQHNKSNPNDKKESIFTGSGDVNKITDPKYNKSNFVTHVGSFELDESTWNSITQLLTGKTPTEQVKAQEIKVIPAQTGIEPVKFETPQINQDVKVEVKPAVTPYSGDFVEREVDGKKQRVAIIDNNGKKERKLINADGSLGSNVVATKTLGKNEYITGDFPQGTKILERVVDGKKQQIGVYESSGGTTLRRLLSTDEKGNKSLGEALIPIATLGKNKYITQSQFDANVREALSLTKDTPIPTDIVPQYVSIGGEPTLVFKKDGKIMDNAELTNYKNSLQTHQEVNAEQDSTVASEVSNQGTAQQIENPNSTVSSGVSSQTAQVAQDETIEYTKEGIMNKVDSLKIGEFFSYIKESGFGDSIYEKTPVTWTREQDNTLTKTSKSLVRMDGRGNHVTKNLSKHFSPDGKTLLSEDVFAEDLVFAKELVAQLEYQGDKPTKLTTDLSNLSKDLSKGASYASYSGVDRVLSSLFQQSDVTRVLNKYSSQNITNSDGDVVLSFKDKKFYDKSGNEISYDDASKMLSKLENKGKLGSLVQIYKQDE